MSVHKQISESEKAALLKRFPRGVVAVDLETTGLSPLVDKIIELSAVKITADGVETFDQLVNPEIPIPKHTTDIHGIKDEDVRNSPTIDEVLPKFSEFLSHLSLIAHNAKFDVGFLVFDWNKCELEVPSSMVYCSCKHARISFKESPNHRLGTLAEFLKIPLENHHRALDDALASLLIFARGLMIEDEKKKVKAIKEAKIMHLEDYNNFDAWEIPDHLKGLIKKAESQQVVDILYRGGSHKNKFRPIRPIGLLPMPEGPVLYALCLLSNVHKSFSLKKIREIKDLNGEEIKERLNFVKTLGKDQ